MRTWIFPSILSFILSTTLVLQASAQTLNADSTSHQSSESRLMPAFTSHTHAYNHSDEEMDTGAVKKAVGILFSDDTGYYGKSPIYLPLIKITASNIALWLVDRFIFNFDFSKVSPATWAYNFQRGMTWEDSDRFGNDFFFHPYTGGGYFMDARSVGYTYWESIPFALFGSAEWKFFFENDQPSWGDLINTTINGTFVGEATYRLTSNIIDDSKTGPERAWREAAVAVLSPSRFFSRLITGKLYSVSENPTLEREPTDVRLAVGTVLVNDASSFGTGPVKADINLQIEYGDPFQTDDTKPFSNFKLGAELTNGYQRKLIGGVNGYGLITGTPTQLGPIDTRFGIFQHFNYFDNTAFELGDAAIGVGFVTRTPVSEYHSIYGNLFLSAVPFAGNNAGFAPIDTTQQRDYNFDYGAQALGEFGFVIGPGTVDLNLTAYYYYLHSFYGVPGDNRLALIRPRVSFNVWKNLGIGFEHSIFFSDRTSPTLPAYSITRTEQRIFLQWTWNNFSKE